MPNKAPQLIEAAFMVRAVRLRFLCGDIYLGAHGVLSGKKSIARGFSIGVQ
jgi:hypothetical protein